MNQEVLVTSENVSKKFCRDLKRSLWYGVKDIASEMTGRTVNHDDLRKDEFWAVKDVSFELKRGECLGLIGHNGAGKSTLLKILNGLIKPDKGKITMKGRIGALIELQAGFNPILTGRENIFVNGQILGFSKQEIRAKFDEIVEFSEIGEFIDTPVQNYSSGMKVRLGFAVASQMEPDILIIDEVLAVGDIGFQIKCYNKIDEILKNTAVIFVSHSVQQIARLCEDLLLLDQGEVSFHSNNIYQGIELYLDSFKQERFSGATIQDSNIAITDYYLQSQLNPKKVTCAYKDKLDLKLVLNSKIRLENIVVSVSVNDRSQRPVAAFISEPLNCKIGETEIEFMSDNIYLTKGTYFLTLIISQFNNFDNNDSRQVLIRYDNLAEVIIKHDIKVLLPSAYFINGVWSSN